MSRVLHRFLFLLCMLPLAITGCSRIGAPEKSGELLVAVRAAPGFFVSEDGHASGFEVDLAQAFAESLGVRVRYIPAADVNEMVAMLHAGSVHFAAGMPVDAAPQGIRFTPPLRSTSQWIVQHADVLDIDSLDDLAGRTVDVAAGSPLAATLRALPETQRPTVLEQNIAETTLLGRVANWTVELAAADELQIDIAAKIWPDLRAALRLPGKLDFAWGFAHDGFPDLRDKASTFVAELARTGELARIHDRHFGFQRRIDHEGVERFLDAVRTLLPRWRHEFQMAEELSGIDWRLIAALAWQESKWDPQATSPTKVRGMMMLTEDTADHLKVTNRLDARQSIRAGARYLAELQDQLPATIRQPDRLWLALAAYNMGMGHLNGARSFAPGLKRDPDSWFDMKKVLPLLAQPAYYLRLKSGRARGGEAVIMVENVRTYFDILSRLEPAHRMPFRPSR